MLAHPLYTLCNYSSAATSSPPVPFFFPSSTSSKSYNMSPPFPRSSVSLSNTGSLFNNQSESHLPSLKNWHSFVETQNLKSNPCFHGTSKASILWNWKFQVALIDLDLCCRYSLGLVCVSKICLLQRIEFKEKKVVRFESSSKIASKA
ncbi:hypothetical protein IMY05_004G0012100 [Salix suchowensis]|nr:hypothetical protein IMY05_004G0012100 [Salix suchowensis]